MRRRALVLAFQLLLSILPLTAIASAPGPGRIALAGVTSGPGVRPEVAAVLEQALEAALSKRVGEVVTSGQLSALLGVARQRELLGGASEDSLRSAVASAAASDLLSVAVAARGEGLQITARRTGSQALTRNVQTSSSDLGALQTSAETIVAQLFPDRPLRARKPDLMAGVPAPAPARSARPIRLAVVEVRAVGNVHERAVAALNQLLTPELRKLEGVSVISGTEIADMLGMERQKQLVGCSDEASICMEELAGALDADEMITVDLTELGGTYALTLRRFDVRRSRVLFTEAKRFEKRDGEELLAVIGPSVAALYPDRALKPGRTRGVDSEVVRRLYPPPLPRAVFFSGVAATVATAIAGGVVGYFSLDAQQQYQALARSALSVPVNGEQLVALETRSRSQAGLANALFLGAGGLAVASAVTVFFTDWHGHATAFTATPVVAGGAPGVSVTFGF